MKEWHFYEKVYRRWVVLMIGTLEEFRQSLTENGFDDMDSIVKAKGMCVELTEDNNTANQRCNIIWLNGYETATLIHEITHLVMNCFDETNMPIDRSNTEAFAYYTEYWFTEIQRVLRKYPNGRKPSEAKK